MLLPLTGPSYDLDSRPSSVQRTVNLMPVPIEPGNERVSWALKDVPGLVEFEVCIVPSFSLAAEPEEGAPPLEVQFTLTEIAGTGPFTFAWDFGDGETSTAQNPLHTYEEAGNYDATVTITNACGVQAIEQEILVEELELIEGAAGVGSEPDFSEIVIQAGDYLTLAISHQGIATPAMTDGWDDALMFNVQQSGSSVRMHVFGRLATGTADDYLADFTVSGTAAGENLWALLLVRQGADAHFPSSMAGAGVDYQSGIGSGNSPHPVTKPNGTDHVIITGLMIYSPTSGGATIDGAPPGYTLVSGAAAESTIAADPGYTNRFGFAYKVISGTNTDDPGQFDEGTGSYAGGGSGMFTMGLQYTP
jgi:PKD repeat protein